MLLELFPFVVLNNAMAFVYTYFFPDFFILIRVFYYLLLPCGGGGVSNKHSLLSPFSFFINQNDVQI